MKQVRRTRTAGEIVTEGPHPYVRVTDHAEDGGKFGLHVLTDTDAAAGQVTVALPHPTLPQYGVVLVCGKDAADRLGRALVSAARADASADADAGQQPVPQAQQPQPPAVDVAAPKSDA